MIFLYVNSPTAGSGPPSGGNHGGVARAPRPVGGAPPWARARWRGTRTGSTCPDMSNILFGVAVAILIASLAGAAPVPSQPRPG